MRALVASLAILFCLPVCAAEPSKPATKLTCHIRGLEGDPSGNVKKGTVKVLWESHVTTVVGRAAPFRSGHDNEVLGTEETLFAGTWVTVTPTSASDGKVVARVALEMTKLDETLASSSGKVVRSVGTFEYGKPVKIGGQEIENGKQFWIEVTLDEVVPAAPIVTPTVVPAILHRTEPLPKKKVSP
jgi:hypothetical protein